MSNVQRRACAARGPIAHPAVRGSRYTRAQVTAEREVLFPTITLEVELRNLDLATPIALTKMFALRIEEHKPATRTKSYFFSKSSKPAGSAAGLSAGGPIDAASQFSDDAVRSHAPTRARRALSVPVATVPERLCSHTDAHSLTRARARACHARAHRRPNRA